MKRFPIRMLKLEVITSSVAIPPHACLRLSVRVLTPLFQSVRLRSWSLEDTSPVLLFPVHSQVPVLSHIHLHFNILPRLVNLSTHNQDRKSPLQEFSSFSEILRVALPRSPVYRPSPPSYRVALWRVWNKCGRLFARDSD